VSATGGGSDALRLLLVDNYDSFTWNLAQYLEQLGARVEVRYNDEVDSARVATDELDALVISPGPGRPEHAGATLDLVRAAAGRLPLLGVCLGHQAIAQVHGGRIVRAPAPMHGKTSRIEHDGTGLFAGLPPGFEATRYHSLMVDPTRMDAALRVNARSEDGVVMALEDAPRALFGVQFHPESVLTVEGMPLLANFLDLARRWNATTGRDARGCSGGGMVVNTAVPRRRRRCTA